MHDGWRFGVADRALESLTPDVFQEFMLRGCVADCCASLRNLPLEVTDGCLGEPAGFLPGPRPSGARGGKRKKR